MLKAFDYQCEICGSVEEQILEELELPLPCSKCGKKVKKLISKVSFKLNYNPKTDLCGWANDGYAASQYWKEVNAAKDRGEDVVGAGSSIYDNVTSENVK